MMILSEEANASSAQLPKDILSALAELTSSTDSREDEQPTSVERSTKRKSHRR